MFPHMEMVTLSDFAPIYGGGNNKPSGFKGCAYSEPFC